MAYNKQRNFCVAIVRKAREDYYSNLNERDITDNKQFWKSAYYPFLSKKVGGIEKINLIEGVNVVSEDNEMAEIFK